MTAVQRHELLWQQAALLPSSYREEASSLAKEKDPELLAQDALRMGLRMEAEGQSSSAWLWYQDCLQALELSDDTRRKIQKRLDLVAGGGAFGDQFERSLADFSQRASDYRLIFPMLLAGMAGRLTHSFLLNRLAGGASWRGASALIAGLGSLAIETPIFSLAHRGILELAGERQNWSAASLARELGSSALGLGALKLSSWAGKKFFQGVFRLDALGRPTQAVAYFDSARQISPVLMNWAGLSLARGWELSLLGRDSSSSQNILFHALEEALSLHIGAALGGKLLGNSWRRFENELEARNTIPKIFGMAGLHHAYGISLLPFLDHVHFSGSATLGLGLGIGILGASFWSRYRHPWIRGGSGTFLDPYRLTPQENSPSPKEDFPPLQLRELDHEDLIFTQAYPFVKTLEVESYAKFSNSVVGNMAEHWWLFRDAGRGSLEGPSVFDGSLMGRSLPRGTLFPLEDGSRFQEEMLWYAVDLAEAKPPSRFAGKSAIELNPFLLQGELEAFRVAGVTYSDEFARGLILGRRLSQLRGLEIEAVLPAILDLRSGLISSLGASLSPSQVLPPGLLRLYLELEAGSGESLDRYFLRRPSSPDWDQISPGLQGHLRTLVGIEVTPLLLHPLRSIAVEKKVELPNLEEDPYRD